MVSGEKKAVAAIGNFDGVHLGHQRLIAETAALARAMDAKLAVVVFVPHPRRFFRPDDPPFLLTTAQQRDALLTAHGVERVDHLAFNATLSAMTPEEFVYDILKGALDLAGVVTGTEFRFGKGRAGDVGALKKLCETAGMRALAVTPAGEGPQGQKIGSSVIRTALQAGEIRNARRMLGRPWEVEGEIVRGAQLGRTLGFPTANMTLGELIEPRRGVYAVEAEVKGRLLGGVANFGRKPTVGAPAALLETHLFDYDGDLYGAPMKVRFLDFLRDERKFDGLDALKAQIAADSIEARARLLSNAG